MNKVEELKHSLLISIGDYKRCPTKSLLDEVIVAHINSLISTVRADEREKIRNAEGVLRLGNDERHAVWITEGEYFILPAAVLVPKEQP